MPPNPRSLPPPTAAIDAEWASDESDAAPGLTAPQIPAPPRMPADAKPAAEPEPVVALTPEPAAPSAPEPPVEAAAPPPEPAAPEPTVAAKANASTTGEAGRSRVATYAVAAVVLVLLGIWLVRSPRPVLPAPVNTPPVAPPASAAVVAPEPSASAAVVAPEPSASAAVVAPESSASAAPSAQAATADASDAVTVVLSVVPEGAKVYHKGQLLGRSPLTLDLAKGERRALEVSSQGYVTRRLIVDGTKTDVSLRLMPEARE